MKCFIIQTVGPAWSTDSCKNVSVARYIFQLFPDLPQHFVMLIQEIPLPSRSRRYHLYIAYGCPCACRCLSTLKIKCLGRAISFTVNILIVNFMLLKYNGSHIFLFMATYSNQNGKEQARMTSILDGYSSFRNWRTWSRADPLNGARSIRELYRLQAKIVAENTHFLYISFISRGLHL